MDIEKVVLEYKKTKDKKLFNYIISHYKPIFKSSVRKYYGKSYDMEIDEVFEDLIKYYFENDLKDKLSGYLYKKSKTIFNTTCNFNEVIHNDCEKMKDHYINKMYNTLLKQNKKTILLKSEILELVKYDVNNMFKNYLSSEKASHVSNYFNVMIDRKVRMYKNEEKLILSYAKHIKNNNRIQTYFYNKFFYIYESYELDSIDVYKECINDILSSDFSMNSTILESILFKKIRNKKSEIISMELEKLKEGKTFDYDLLKKHYSYIKDMVFDKYKDEVFITSEELKDYINKKYDKYFNVGIEYIKKRPNKNLARYINNRLSDIIKRHKSFFKPFYVDEGIKEKNIQENSDIIYKVLKKYNNLYENEDILLKIIECSYYKNAELFYKKERKAKFNVYVRNQINIDLNSINFKDEDEINEYLEKIKA